MINQNSLLQNDDSLMMRIVPEITFPNSDSQHRESEESERWAPSDSVSNNQRSLHIFGDEEILKKVKQGVGRTSKLKALACVELDCAKPGQEKEKKKRGRKPKAIAGPSMLREISEGSSGVDPEFARLRDSVTCSGSGAYFTRAQKAWSVGKFAGLSFPGSDEEAVRGLAKELEEDFNSIQNLR